MFDPEIDRQPLTPREKWNLQCATTGMRQYTGASGLPPKTLTILRHEQSGGRGASWGERVGER